MLKYKDYFMNITPTSPEAESHSNDAQLTREQESAIHNLYRNLLRNIHDTSILVPLQSIELGFASINPPPQNQEEARKETAVIFCDELIRITKAMHESTGSLTSRETLQFLQKIRISCFNSTFTDVTDYLSDMELLKFTRAFTQIPCAHLGIGKHVTTKVIERFNSINPTEIPALIEALHALPLSERLDLAQLFPNLFRDLDLRSTDDHDSVQMPRSAQARDATRQQAISVMARVMNSLQHGATSALEELSIRNAQNNSLLELEAQVRPEGLQNRIHEEAMHDAQMTHEHLAKRLHINAVVQKNERIVTIGNNAVGIMGPTGVIRAIGLCDHMKLTEEAPFSTTVLQDVRSRLSLGMTNGLFFEMVDEEILHNISTDTSRQEFWRQVFPDVPEEKLRECLDAIMKERTARKNGASTLLAEAEKSITARVDSMRRSIDEIVGMIEEIENDSFLRQFDVYLKRFRFYQTVEIPARTGSLRSEKNRGIPHQAMQAIDCLILAAEHQRGTRKNTEMILDGVVVAGKSPILERLKAIRNQAYAEDTQHVTVFQKLRSEHSKKYQETMPDNAAAVESLNRELQKQNGKQPLTEALDKLDSTYLATLPSVDVHPTEEFLRDTRFYPFEASNQDEEIKTFALLHNPEMRRSLEEQLGISYDDMSLQSLFQLGRFLRNKKPADFLEMRIVLNAQGLPPHEPDTKKNMLTSFLACSEDIELGNTVLSLGKFDGVDPVFNAYAHLATTAEETAQVLAQELHTNNPQSAISQHYLYRQLLQRGNQLLLHAAKLSRTAENRSENIMDAARALEAESGKVSAARMFFMNAASMLRSGQEIDLRSHAQEQKFVLQALNASGGKASLLRALHEKNALEPIPEIFWRVDRTAEEYNDRFGFDVTKFLDTYSLDRQQLLVEFGPGNGTFKKHRSETTKGYLDVAMCDRLYYPVSTFIQNTIDFALLAADGVHLTPEQQGELCDFLYRIVSIKNGQTGLDQLENDDVVMEALRKDPKNITDIMIAKSSQFQTVKAVPKGTVTRNERGENIYTEKMPRPRGKHLDEACKLPSTDMKKYLRTSKQDFDVFDSVPAYAAGTILSDFSDVKNLADDQIDAALGVRSTVYLKEEVYTDFMSSMTKKISEDGLYIDDNIRENHGFRYRFSELQNVERQTGYPLMVIMGPELEGNDLEGTSEPRAVVMTKSKQKLEYIRSNLSSGFSIRPLSEVLADSRYLETLAKKGRIELSKLQAA